MMDAVEGKIDPPASSLGSQAPTNNLDTLDEPVSVTIMRDLKMVAIKLKHVMIPKDTAKELRNWDLWGPLILCLLLASTLSFRAAEDQVALTFATVFVIVWVGAGIVTANAALLGGNASFLHCVCVLGYCLFPLNLASILCHFWGNKIFQGIVVAVAFLWSSRASVGFMAQLVADDRKALAVYPVLLFYLYVAWMILVQ